MDRTKYQPWLFYYPSGLQIPTLGNGLLGMLNELWLEHRFHELHIVAHSMGGLVTRSFLNT
jgi:pimeloyl-ACP methyl ester carboxylesterase